MTIVTIVLSNSTSLTAATSTGFVSDFRVELPKALVVHGKKCRLLEMTCLQHAPATGIKLITIELPFLSSNMITASSSNAVANGSTAANVNYDISRPHNGGSILLTCLSRTQHSLFPVGHDYDLSTSTIPKHFTVRLKSGVDGLAAPVLVRYMVLKFAMDIANV